MSFSGWVAVAARVAKSPAGQWVRRKLAERSAKELRRRQNEKHEVDYAHSRDFDDLD